MDSFARHVRVAFRKLARSPLFAATALLTLAVGIGANSAIFSVVNGVLLKPLPYDEPESLLGLWNTAPGLGFDELNQSPAVYLTYRADTETLEDVALWAGRSAQITGLEEPEQVDAMLVTDGFFPVLRASTAAGRFFAAEDDQPGAARTVVISHSYWQRALGGDPGAVGQALTVNGNPFEIIGVVEEGFSFLDQEPDVYYTPRFDPAEVMMGNFSYQLFARMKPDVTIEQVDAELGRLVRTAVDRYPGPVTHSMFEQARFATVTRPLKEDVVGDVRPVLWVLLGTVGMVLLIACANVANLFLVRAEGRTREVAVRTALGADRKDIAGQFLGESVVLGLAGGVGGVLLAFGGLRLLRALGPGNLPRLDQIGIDGTVLGFTLAISVLAGVLFGLVPLLRYGAPDLVPSLKEGGRGGSAGRTRRRAQHGLVVAQMALALVLLVGSGLMIRSFQSLRSVDPGFDAPEELMTFRVTIPSSNIESPEGTIEAFRQMEERLAAIPGVEDVGSVTGLPMGGFNSNDPVFVEGADIPQGELPPIRRFQWMLPGYIDAMGIPLLAGRDLDWIDLNEQRNVVVVSETFARENWDDPRIAIGKRVSALNISGGQAIWHEIVGVVGDVREDGLDQDAPATMYWPAIQAEMYGEGMELRRSLVFVMRMQPGTMEGVMPQAQAAIWGVQRVPLAQVRTLESLVDRSLARTSFTLVMLGIAAAVALLLGAIGIYGVISYAVSQRTREIGVRMALGAERGQVSAMVVKQGLVLAGLGVVIGLAAALGVSRVMSSLLFGISPLDVPTYAAVAGVLSLVAIFASWLPARRAAGVDPAVTLREE